MTDRIAAGVAGAVAARGLNSRTEVGTIRLDPKDLARAGAAKLEGGVLTIQNAKLASLIQTKLADASRLSGAKAATDVDVSVGVKVKK